jgi:hypothetical protein
MKRTILATIIGIAAVAAVNSAQAQGRVNLDNYDSTAANPLVTYGAGVPGGAVGTGLANVSGITWTVGIYYALGSVSVASDPTGIADPASLGPLAQATGVAGDTTTFNSGLGFFTTTGDASFGGYTSGLVTAELVAYSGPTYNGSSYRGHSGAFTFTPATGATAAPLVGNFFPTFGALPVPEPSIFALSGIGAAALMLIRRKK